MVYCVMEVVVFRRMWPQYLMIMSVVLVLTGSLAACGNQEMSQAGKANAFSNETVAQQVPIAADPAGGLKWDRATYEAKAGDITFVVKNASATPHQFSIEGNGVDYKSPNFNGNTTNTYTVKGLPAGEYLIVCNYPGHRAAGMISKLIVR